MRSTISSSRAAPVTTTFGSSTTDIRSACSPARPGSSSSPRRALNSSTRPSRTRTSSCRPPSPRVGRRLDVVRGGIYPPVTNIRSSAPSTLETPMTLENPMLTSRQQEIWQFLAEYVDAHGYPPTVREIGDAVGLASPSTVHAHLANLERAGLLKRDPTKPRAIELIGRKRDSIPAGESVERTSSVPTLPLLGQIAAGGPLLAEESVED